MVETKLYPIQQFSNGTSASRMKKWTLKINPKSRPVSKVTEENIALFRSLIEEDPHSTYEDIQAVLPLSNRTIQTIIHEHLRLRKLTS